jgi:hypothetical protein
MIAAVGEGFPYTFWQDAIGGLGLFLAMLGVYLGFSIGKTKKTIASMATGKQPAGPLMTLGNVRDRWLWHGVRQHDSEESRKSRRRDGSRWTAAFGEAVKQFEIEPARQNRLAVTKLDDRDGA